MIQKLLTTLLLVITLLWASGSVRKYSLEDAISFNTTFLIVKSLPDNTKPLAISIPYKDSSGHDKWYKGDINCSRYKVVEVLALYRSFGYDESFKLYIPSDDVKKLPQSKEEFLNDTIRVVSQRGVINNKVAVRYLTDGVRKFPIYYDYEQEILPKESDSTFILICSPNVNYNSFVTVGIISTKYLSDLKELLRSSTKHSSFDLFFEE